ncbi:mitochondrial protein required for respiration [Irpex rosettiformis]|uniref:Mitochondrial protein required for respiration n=1 Tax=Irpex rosettiformis TaxID=378272 RepID=A0ACB8UJL5_9APHY|nr:mitochondrial protein required for respiration [Irpex rosettiformis]
MSSWTGLRRGVLSSTLWRRQLFKKPLASNCRRTESTNAAATPAYRAKKDSLLSPTMILLGIVPIFTFALGTWQVARLKWKINLIDELQEKLSRDPMPLPRKLNLDVVPEFVYRKVLLRGRWDHAHAMLLGPRVHDGAKGYHVIEPLLRADGTTLLVDRGFVSQEQADNKSYLKDDGREVEVLGMLRTGHTRNNFTPDNKPNEGIWYWGDIDAMAAYAGGEQAGVQPVYIEEIFEGHAGEASSRVARGIPLGRPPTVDVRNSHASYVVTWYSLSAFTSVMFVRLLLKQRRARASLPR